MLRRANNEDSRGIWARKWKVLIKQRKQKLKKRWASDTIFYSQNICANIDFWECPSLTFAVTLILVIEITAFFVVRSSALHLSCFYCHFFVGVRFNECQFQNYFSLLFVFFFAEATFVSSGFVFACGSTTLFRWGRARESGENIIAEVELRQTRFRYRSFTSRKFIFAIVKLYVRLIRQNFFLYWLLFHAVDKYCRTHTHCTRCW